MVFEVFRRRQKQMLAFLAIVAIFGFILGDVFTRIAYNTRSDAARDRVVAEAWGVKIYNSHVGRRQFERHIANRFFERAFEKLKLAVPPRWDESREAAIEAIVLLEKARQLGIPLDTDEVDTFIKMTTNNKLSASAFVSTLSEVGKSTQFIGDRELFRIIAEELLIEKVLRVLSPPGDRRTPLELWERHAPSLTKVKLDVVAVPVEKFVDASKSPSDDELQKLFDAHKQLEADSERGIVGFRAPRRLQVQYLLAQSEKFTSDINVTDAEIEKYYQDNKDEFREAPAIPAPTDAKSESSSIPKPPTIPAKKSEAEQKPKSPAKTVKPAPPQEKSTSPDPKKSEPNAQEKAKAAQPPQKKTAMLPGAAPFAPAAAIGLVHLFEPIQSEKPKASAGQPTNSKTAEVKNGDGKSDGAKPTEQSKPVGNLKTELKKDSTQKPTALEKAPATGPHQPPPAAENKSEPETPPKYKPLASVRPEIVAKLKKQKAGERVQQKFREIAATEVFPHHERYARAREAHRSSDAFRSLKPEEQWIRGELAGFTPPAAPDFGVVAKNHGFELHTTAAVSPAELSKLEGIGTAVRAADVPFGAPYSSLVLNQELYQGTALRDAAGDRHFLAWKIRDQQAHVPELTDVKDQVVRAWRLEQAKPLAEGQAKKLVDAIEKAGGDFAKALPKDSGYAVATTQEFARKSRGFESMPFQGPPRFFSPTIAEVPDAGEAFLDAVFAMTVGQVQVLPDEHKRNYYVVRVKERVEPDFNRYVDELRLERRFNSQNNLIEQMIQVRRIWASVPDQMTRFQLRFSSENFFQPAIESVLSEAKLRVEADPDETESQNAADG